MADSVRITSPIKIADNSTERVALELMIYIRDYGGNRADEILELFARCLLTTQSPTLGLNEVKKRVKGDQ